MSALSLTHLMFLNKAAPQYYIQKLHMLLVAPGSPSLSLQLSTRLYALNVGLLSGFITVRT